MPFSRGLLDTGAQGSNFISRQLYDSLPPSVTNLSRPIDGIVRLGDARFLSIQLEVPLTVGILDSIAVWGPRDLGPHSVCLGSYPNTL